MLIGGNPTCLEWLSRLITSIRNLPVLLIVTFRPEFAPPWVGQSNVTNLKLNRLGRREIAGIMRSGNKIFHVIVHCSVIETRLAFIYGQLLFDEETQ
jgi:hypothetical protein